MASQTPAAVVVAHPGHEVRIHGWLERECPQVFILTDGSGRAGQPRIASTTEYLKKFGLKPQSIYGRLTDLDVYEAVLKRDVEPFISFTEEMAETFVRLGTEEVVGDASEGYNPTHDICRLIINAAVEIARRTLGGSIKNYDYPLVNRPDHCPQHLRDEAVWLQLDDGAFKRKLGAAREFYPQLASETEETLQGNGDDVVKDYFDLNESTHAATELKGLDMFRVECLRPVSPGDLPFESELPYYEVLGETRVKMGHYQQVIRYREHIVPIADAILENVERRA